MFSPETYALLNEKIESSNKNIDDIETSLSGKWTKGATTAPTSVATAIESSFTTAEQNAMFTGSYGASSYLWCWYGIKFKADRPAMAFFIAQRNTGGASIGVAKRSSTGEWSFDTLE